MDLSFLDAVGGVRVVGGVAAVGLIVWVVSKLLKKKPAAAHVERKRCDHCGWEGSVSKYKPKCAKCGKDL